MDKVRVEVGMKGSLNTKLASSKLTWLGHVEKVGEEKLAECGREKEASKTEIAMSFALRET